MRTEVYHRLRIFYNQHGYEMGASQLKTQQVIREYLHYLLEVANGCTEVKNLALSTDEDTAFVETLITLSGIKNEYCAQNFTYHNLAELLDVRNLEYSYAKVAHRMYLVAQIYLRRIEAHQLLDEALQALPVKIRELQEFCTTLKMYDAEKAVSYEYELSRNKEQLNETLRQYYCINQKLTQALSEASGQSNQYGYPIKQDKLQFLADQTNIFPAELEDYDFEAANQEWQSCILYTWRENSRQCRLVDAKLIARTKEILFS